MSMKLYQVNLVAKQAPTPIFNYQYWENFETIVIANGDVDAKNQARIPLIKALDEAGFKPEETETTFTATLLTDDLTKPYAREAKGVDNNGEEFRE
jgi:hypothetical protein